MGLGRQNEYREYLMKKIRMSGHAPNLVWGVGGGYLEGGVAAQHIALIVNLPWIFGHETNDIEDLREPLIRMWQSWRENKAIAKPNQSFIREFSTERLPIKLADALKGGVHILNFQPDTEDKI